MLSASSQWSSIAKTRPCPQCTAQIFRHRSVSEAHRPTRSIKNRCRRHLPTGSVLPQEKAERPRCIRRDRPHAKTLWKVSQMAIRIMQGALVEMSDPQITNGYHMICLSPKIHVTRSLITCFCRSIPINHVSSHLRRLNHRGPLGRKEAPPKACAIAATYRRPRPHRTTLAPSTILRADFLPTSIADGAAIAAPTSSQPWTG